ncbi:hypothetical protein [Thermoactinomyces sp. CICC 10522]|uniref:hypothetical protein n=1 Tax=Thermoactinomyces sp. CICC 10522 TaxID=2767427 RepID=UPI0018DDFF12|nr:hypothetical protein [Thermoactinomyces sp. CICC 10522]MBH8605759.1 hypothetical protein [Thermoactinomyces sp. CICC 10522]
MGSDGINLPALLLTVFMRLLFHFANLFKGDDLHERTSLPVQNSIPHSVGKNESICAED